MSDYREYIEALRWPDGFRCPRCGGDRAWRTSRGLLRCPNRKCNSQVSATSGTMLAGTKLSSEQLVYLADCLASNDFPNIRRVAQRLSMTDTALWQLLYKFIYAVTQATQPVVCSSEIHIGMHRIHGHKCRGRQKVPSLLRVIVLTGITNGLMDDIMITHDSWQQANETIQAAASSVRLVTSDRSLLVRIYENTRRGVEHLPKSGDNIVNAIRVFDRWRAKRRDANWLPYMIGYAREFRFRFRNQSGRGELRDEYLRVALNAHPLEIKRLTKSICYNLPTP